MSLAFRDRVAAYFKDRPNAWTDGLELSDIGGKYAWRSRVSDCRRELGMVIENRIRHVVTLSGDRIVKSEYRYVPTPGEASPSHTQTADLNSWSLR